MERGAGMSKQKTNWKAIALELEMRVVYAIQNLRPYDDKTKQIFLLDEDQVVNWRVWMGEGIEKIPGRIVHFDIFDTMDLPRSKRKTAQKKIIATRNVEKIEVPE
jgi:hypothetical protein